jgi:hypothetical protein
MVEASRLAHPPGVLAGTCCLPQYHDRVWAANGEPDITTESLDINELMIPAKNHDLLYVGRNAMVQDAHTPPTKQPRHLQK